MICDGSWTSKPQTIAMEMPSVACLVGLINSVSLGGLLFIPEPCKVSVKELASLELSWGENSLIPVEFLTPNLLPIISQCYYYCCCCFSRRQASGRADREHRPWVMGRHCLEQIGCFTQLLLRGATDCHLGSALGCHPDASGS